MLKRPFGKPYVADSLNLDPPKIYKSSIPVPPQENQENINERMQTNLNDFFNNHDFGFLLVGEQIFQDDVVADLLLSLQTKGASRSIAITKLCYFSLGKLTFDVR